MAGGLIGIVDYVVSEVSTEVGHARVYNRHRSTRNREKFEELFVGAGSLNYWTCRRTVSDERHRGASHQSVRTHTIRVEGTMAAADEELDGDSREVLLQDKIEDLADRFRQDPALNNTVEHSSPSEGVVRELKVAGVACYRGHLLVEAREALYW